MEVKDSIYKGRFKDADWFNEFRSTEILLLGAGGISSWVAFGLSRIGCNFTIQDFDIVGAENLGGQLYGLSHINTLKVDACREICLEFSGNENVITTVSERYTKDSLSNPIVIVGFDNMAGRKLAFKNWCNLVDYETSQGTDLSKYLFIDGRLSMESWQIYTVKPTTESREKYIATLFNDSDVPDLPCTLKSTTHCSMSIGSEIIAILTNFMTNIATDFDMREVPFRISKEIPFFMYDVNN